MAEQGGVLASNHLDIGRESKYTRRRNSRPCGYRISRAEKQECLPAGKEKRQYAQLRLRSRDGIENTSPICEMKSSRFKSCENRNSFSTNEDPSLGGVTEPHSSGNER